MNFAMFALSVHMLVAVLGVGTIGALPLAARSARHAGLAPSALAVWALPLVLTARLSLLLAFASGALLDFAYHGAFHQQLWFRFSGLLLLSTAICLARGRAALKLALSGARDCRTATNRVLGLYVAEHSGMYRGAHGVEAILKTCNVCRTAYQGSSTALGHRPRER